MMITNSFFSSHNHDYNDNILMKGINFFHSSRLDILNSLGPGRSGCNFKNAIFNIVLPNSVFRSYDKTL